MTIGALLGKLSVWAFCSCLCIGGFLECYEYEKDYTGYVQKSVISGCVVGVVITYIVTGGMIDFFEWLKPILDTEIL